MNALTTVAPDDDTASEIAQLKRTIALTMQLIEREAARALGQPAGPDDESLPKCKSADPVQNFVRLNTCLRQAMALKARFVARVKTAPTAKPAAAPDDAPAEPAKPGAPSNHNQQEFMNSTTLTQRLNPGAYRYANRK